MQKARPSTDRAAPPRHRATVAAGFVKGMLSGLAARAMDGPQLLTEVGLDPRILENTAARVPIDDYVALYNAVVQRSGDEGFCLFSQPLRPGCFEFLCRSMITSRTLLEALNRGTRFMGLVLPQLPVRIERDASAARICIEEPQALQAAREDPRRIFAFEWLLRLMHGLACWMAGRDLALYSVEFPYARPAHAADYDLIYTARSQFDGKCLVASMAANLLDLPVRRDDEALAQFLNGAPGKIAALYRRDRQMVRRVRDIVANSFPEPLTLEQVARRLNLSTRSVHRRLHEEGSSLRAIKDALRRDLALARLEKTTATIAEVAAELGYADPSAFFRAFVEWTGMAPSDYRKRLGTGAR
ncbi:MAG: AraC family transcriptional regulator [Rhodocyclaceae bacterium]|nr:AraC family transcriptional regulator [Rhodocyclaceae bacterium]MBX3668252.1 AraC family transcriptional regulator [Rhodocyclaceae bacterium]